MLRIAPPPLSHNMRSVGRAGGMRGDTDHQGHRETERLTREMDGQSHFAPRRGQGDLGPSRAMLQTAIMAQLLAQDTSLEETYQSLDLDADNRQRARALGAYAAASHIDHAQMLGFSAQI